MSRYKAELVEVATTIILLPVIKETEEQLASRDFESVLTRVRVN